MPCLSCQKSSSTPLNFLLNCSSCPSSWHHRCHSPPVSDKELIAIIKAFNAEKHNTAAKLIWQCGICIKYKGSVKQRNLVASKKATPQTIPSQKAIDDDDDEIIALDGPPEAPNSNHAVILQRPSTTQDASDQLTVQPPPSKDKIIRIIDDPFLVPDPSLRAFKSSQTSSSSKPPVISGLIDLSVSSDEEMNAGGDDDTLEYLTPPPTPAPSSKQVVEIVEEVPLILTSNQAPTHSLPRDAGPASTMTSSHRPPNQLLSQWLNDRSTAAGVKPDLWARARLRRDQDVANRKCLRGEDSVQPVPSISPPSRLKCKAHKLNDGSHPYPRAAFFLSAEGWLREKQLKLE